MEGNPEGVPARLPACLPASQPRLQQLSGRVGGSSRSRKGRKKEEKSFLQGSYLVDPASSHMLVSKIKPCMSKYKPN